MKNLLLFTLIILFNFNCFSKKKPSKKIKTQHLTYQEYLNEYGNNKTSITIINIFFQKRDNTGIGKMSLLPLSASITTVIPPIGAGLMVASSPFFISGLITRTKYSHKNLLRALHEFKANQFLSKNLKKKIIRERRIEQDIYIKERSEYNLALLRQIYN